jgi:hypothetical protein
MSLSSHPEPLVNTWREASKKLGFAFESPYTLMVGDERFSVIGFLPHFGSPRGMVLDIWVAGVPDSTRALQQAARRAQIFCSSVSVETYSDYNREAFIEALNDWGYFGPEKARPPWARRGGR